MILRTLVLLVCVFVGIPLMVMMLQLDLTLVVLVALIVFVCVRSFVLPFPLISLYLIFLGLSVVLIIRYE